MAWNPKIKEINMSLETVEDINKFFDDLELQCEERKKKITHDKENAHKVLTTINGLFKEFQMTGFLSGDDNSPLMSEVYYRIIQKDLQDGLVLIKFLKEKEKAIASEIPEALNVYHIMLGKCLIRLSCLIHDKRVETSEEFGKWIGLYR